MKENENILNQNHTSMEGKKFRKINTGEKPIGAAPSDTITDEVKKKKRKRKENLYTFIF